MTGPETYTVEGRKAVFSDGRRVKLTDMWRTPQEVFDALDREFDFVLDAAATADSALVPSYFGPDHEVERFRDAFAIEWSSGGGPVYCNPPYGGGQLSRWIDACATFGSDVPVVALVPATPATAWFRYAFETAFEIRLLPRRIAFLDPLTGEAGTSPRGDNAVIVWLPHTAGPARVRYWEP